MSGPLTFDRVKETCSSPGTGTVTLLGAVSQFQAFSVVGDGNTTFYCIKDQSGTKWEVGRGTYTLSGTTLSRSAAAVLDGSSGVGTLVNFSSGTQDVFADLPAAMVSTPNTVYNVKAFGAKGDNSANDSTAIQAALDACNAAGGGAVYLPAGTYALGSGLTIYSNVHLRGAGYVTTMLIQKSGNNFDLIKSYQFDTLVGGNTNAGINSFGIYDLKLHGFQSGDSVQTTTVSDNPLTSGATTINVGSTTGFPANSGYVMIDYEAIYYESVTGTTFVNCQRGCLGSTAASHTQTTNVFSMVVDGIATTALTADPGTGGTTLALTDTTGFPTAGTVRVEGELITFTGRSTSSGAGNLTGCTRGCEGTTAAAHAIGKRAAWFKPWTGCGLKIYGYGYTIQNVRITSCRGPAIYSEWATTASSGVDNLETLISNVKFHTSQNYSVEWAGPHDSQFSNMVVSDSNLANVRFITDPARSANGCQVVNSHSFAVATTLNAPFAWEIRASSVMLANCVGETASVAQVVVTAPNVVITGMLLYDVNVLNKGLMVGQVSGTGGSACSGLTFSGRIINCVAGAVDFTGDAGSNWIQANVYQTTGTAVVGTPAASTLQTLYFTGGVTAPSTAFPLTILPSQAKVLDPTNDAFFKVTTSAASKVAWIYLESTLVNFGGIIQWVSGAKVWQIGSGSAVGASGLNFYTQNVTANTIVRAINIDAVQRIGIGGAANASYGLYQTGGSQRLLALTTPSAPTTSVGGGTPAGATDFYFVVAEDRAGLQTLTSAASSSAARGSSAANWRKVVWSAVAGAYKYYVLVNTSATPAAATLMTLTGTWTPGRITGVSSITGGSGGANGTFSDGTFDSGGGSSGTFAYTISGGAVTNICVLNTGTGYTSQPTFTMPSKGSLVSFSATANIAAYSEAGGTNLEADDSGQAINGAFTLPTRNATADSTVDGEVILHNGLTTGNILASGTIFTATATATANTKNQTITLIGTGVGTLTLPANFLIPGRTIRIRIKGTMTTTVTSACTLTFLAKLGSTTICTSAAVAPSTAVSNLSFEADCDITCRTVGSGGTVFGQGSVLYYNSATVTNSWGMPATGTASIDTTTSQVIDFQVTQSNTTNAQTISATNATVEILN